MKRQINIKGAECKVSSLSVWVVQLDRFESAGSRAVIGRKLSYPRTGLPEGFTASCPHMGPGMGGDYVVERGRRARCAFWREETGKGPARLCA